MNGRKAREYQENVNKDFLSKIQYIDVCPLKKRMQINVWIFINDKRSSVYFTYYYIFLFLYYSSQLSEGTCISPSCHLK